MEFLVVTRYKSGAKVMETVSEKGLAEYLRLCFKDHAQYNSVREWEIIPTEEGK